MYVGVLTQRSALSSEATCGGGMEKGTDEVLDFDIRRDSQKSASPQPAIGPGRTFVDLENIPPYPSWEFTLVSVTAVSLPPCHMP